MPLESTTRRDADIRGSVPSLYPYGMHKFMSSGSRGAEPILERSASNLGASSISFERSRKTAGVALAFASTLTSRDIALTQAVLPSELEVPNAHMATGNGTPAPTGTSNLSEEERALITISAAADAEPIEDGMRHPAEPAIAAYVGRYGARSLMKHAFRNGNAQARTAALIRLLGRVRAVDAATRHDLVELGLACASVEVRDAAMQAAENWEDAKLASLLRAHREPVAWLAEYAHRVARDLGA